MAETHYVLYFTVVNLSWVRFVRTARAACGLMVAFPGQHSAEPTCPRCEAWLQADASEAAALEELWDMESRRQAARKDSMNIGSAFPSTYLKAADLQGRRVSVTMAGVRMEDIGGEQKPILSFVGKDKGLVLNKTNANMIAEITGSEETDDWQGHAVVLYPTKTDFQGKRVDAIRVDYSAPANGQPTKSATRVVPKAAVVEQELEEDSIPF